MTHTEIASKYSEIIMKETLEMLTEVEKWPNDRVFLLLSYLISRSS